MGIGAVQYKPSHLNMRQIVEVVAVLDLPAKSKLIITHPEIDCWEWLTKGDLDGCLFEVHSVIDWEFG